MDTQKKYKIVYVTPALYMAGGVERVLTTKANCFAEQFGYDITIVLTEGKDKPLFYPLSSKVKVINLDLNFEKLWTCSFLKKIWVYLPKQRRFKKLLTAELMLIRPDITISLLRREINFITGIKDGSKKIGELHVNRANYRNFEANETNFIKRLFAKFWMWNLIGHLKELDQFVVLTESECLVWPELSNICVIPDPLYIQGKKCSTLSKKRIVSIGRYAYQKGVDLLLQAWGIIEKDYPDWELSYYGQGNKEPFLQQIKELNLDSGRCHLNDKTTAVQQELLDSSIFVLSSRFEGFGLVLIEAMACGLPIVSFDCKTGPSDIISDGSNGFLVPVGDVKRLADKLSVLMKNQELRIQFGKCAFQHSSKYEINDIANQWSHLFDQLMRK